MFDVNHVVTAVDFSPATEVMRKTTVPVLLDRIEPAGDDAEAQCAGVCDEKFRRPLLATDLSKSAEGAESAVFLTVRDARDSDASAEVVREEPEALGDRAACPTTVRVEQGRAASAAIADVAEFDGPGPASTSASCSIRTKMGAKRFQNGCQQGIPN